MVPATVHAALVVVVLWVLTQLAALAGVNVSESFLTELATLLVSYILSLGGLALFRRAASRPGAVGPFDDYKPPFT